MKKDYLDCRNCAFSVSKEHEEHNCYACRRYPPTVVPGQAPGKTISKNPRFLVPFWCGEFIDKKEFDLQYSD